MNRRHGVPAAVLAMVSLLLAGCGGSESAESQQKQPTESVEITITDGAFKPPQLAFKQGTTVELVFKNEGKLDHEALIADTAGQDEHERMMKEHPDMHHPPGESPNIVDVHHGETARLVYTFDKRGTMLIGCHKQPDHYARGERMRVIVS